MARIRTIKPEFFRHAELYDAEKRSGLPLRLAFAGLWTAADREGRFRWKPRELKLDCLPFDECDFALVLEALAESGFIMKYEIDGESFGCVPAWKNHQFINNREVGSKIPAARDGHASEPRVDDASATRHNNAQAQAQAEGEGEGKGREGKEDAAVPAASVSEEKQLYDLGKVILGQSSGGIVKKLVVAKDGDIPQARIALEMARGKSNPREYLGAIIRTREGGECRPDRSF